jgi:hypothetical protein
MIDNNKIKLLFRSNFIVLIIIIIFSILLTFFYIKKYENYTVLRLNISDINTNSFANLIPNYTFFFEDELLNLPLNVKNWDVEFVYIANVISKVNLNKFSPDNQFILKIISNPEWWRKSVIPVYALNKLDSKEFRKSHNKVEYLDIKFIKFDNFGEGINQDSIAKLIRMTIALWYLDKLENFLDYKFSFYASNSTSLKMSNELNLKNASISLKKINDLGNNIIINSGDKNDLFAIYSHYLTQHYFFNDLSDIKKIWGTKFKISNVINSKANYPGESIFLNNLDSHINFIYNFALNRNNNFYIIPINNVKIIYIYFVVFLLFFFIILLLHFFLKLFTAKRFFIFRL